MHSNSQANDGQGATGMRPVSIPRPTTQPKALAPVAKGSAPPRSRPVSEVPKPPPAPRRSATKRPPPLPAPVLLTDADLVDDEDVTRVVRDARPTAVDVELDCFSCTEPPPPSRPRRKRALLVCVTGLVLVAATGVSFLARPLASNALRLLDVANSGVARAPAILAGAAISSPAAPVAALNATPLSAAPSAASSAGARSKLSTYGKRSRPAIVNHKKSIKPARAQRVVHAQPAKQ